MKFEKRSQVQVDWVDYLYIHIIIEKFNEIQKDIVVDQSR